MTRTLERVPSRVATPGQGLFAALHACELEGMRYHHRARVPGRRGATDCVGVPLLSWWAAGVDLPDFDYYTRQPQPEVLLAAIRERCRPVPHGEEWPGDIATFGWPGATSDPEAVPDGPNHVGVFVQGAEGPQIVHAYIRARRVLRVNFAGALLGQFAGAWRPLAW